MPGGSCTITSTSASPTQDTSTTTSRCTASSKAAKYSRRSLSRFSASKRFRRSDAVPYASNQICFFCSGQACDSTATVAHS